ncbi:YbfB/YjiJ family MFS transporter [Plastoroseomonas hellenica]|uniref:YbfB/YjiJ family MFS transporter n=1 Tax=Plastoroseomonas hellenica TaxID=2687306 RepID=UPI001BAE209F|nr:YbfB/YjiJ family MFS transporter [Plastoroseomonas hellenica]MBR0645672.1 YbfB/YjiJ family MFS transporter [Plastoroseomonas hellenica]
MSLPFLRPALAGAAATCSGIGLARFAYVPLFPAMVAAGWVDGGGAGLIGAVNLTGYLAGTLLGRPAARRLGVPNTLSLGLLLVALAFAACAWNGGLVWLAAWRGLAGIAGGVLMGVTGPSVQAVVSPQRRGAAAGVVIGGVGTGVSLASLLVPLLLPAGLSATWLGLAGLVLVLLAFAHPRWPRPPAEAGAAARPGTVPRATALILSYALSGAGLVPPMVYLADLAVRGRGFGLTSGSLVWLLFGLGGIAGTLTGGRLADALGGRRALTLWMGFQVLAMGLALIPGKLALIAAALTGGFAAMGVTAVALAAAREWAGMQAGILWVRTTAGFAVAQSITGFAMAALFAATGESHAAIFSAGLALSIAALAVAASDRG